MPKVDLILIGNSGVGKTALIQKYLHPQEDSHSSLLATLGIQVEKQVITTAGTQVNLHLWDTAGQERFFALTKGYFQRADGVLVVYDVNDRESFHKLEHYWLPSIADKLDSHVRMLLVGNKIDIKGGRQVQAKEGAALAQRMKGIPFYEASAKSNTSVQEAFLHLTQLCLESIQAQHREEERQ